MKLRSKKTVEVVVEVNKIGLVWNKYGMPAEIGQYDSLAELNEEWEDYKPTKPLIKDEKIRKAVRAWADANGYSIVRVGFYGVADTNIGNIQIHFKESDIVDEDKYGVYNITELCGDDE